MKKRWLLRFTDKMLADRISKELNIHPLIAEILVARGFDSAVKCRSFLYPALSQLPDPFTLPDMEKGADRIIQAIKNNEKITIYGDYDVDGISSTSLLVLFFRACGIKVDYYIPHRLIEGYGLKESAIDKIANSGTTLIITVDTGISAYDAVRYADSKGIDVVVTDHHEIPHRLPSAVAAIDPKRLEGDNSLKNIAGVGVAFYLAAAVRTKLRNSKWFSNETPELVDFLGLVALGTIADVVPLTGVNRIFAKYGLQVLSKSSSKGIRALAEVSSTELLDIDSYAISFRLAPRLNAAGRLGNQVKALELLISESERDVISLAKELNDMNSRRQSIEKRILEEVDKAITKNCEQDGIVLFSDKWHVGVIGIVASRLAKKYSVPAALITKSESCWRGSIRSVGNFNIMDLLSNCSDLLVGYGGHKIAAGFDLNSDKIDKFKIEFQNYITSNLKEEDRAQSFHIDCELSLDDINEKLIRELELLAPYGEANPRPLFGTSPLFVKNSKIVGSNHLKLNISDNITTMDVIGFNLGHHDISTDKLYRFAGHPEINSWNGIERFQLKIKDLTQEK